MPVAVPPPPPLVPVASVMPDLVPPDEPYTLDSGDKLRITVYGQEGLSNTYIVDASGRITMPLIGAVSARGCTTTQLGARRSPTACAAASSASRTWRSRSRPTGRSSSSARC